MKILVIALVAIIMIGGGTVAALKFFEIGPFSGAEKKTEKKEPVIQPPKFVDMPTLNIPLFVDDKVAGVVLVQLKLETKNDKDQILVNRLLPRLNDAFIRELHSFIPRLLAKTKRLDVFILKQRLLMVTDRVAGKGVVNNVLIQSVTNSANQ